MCLLCRGRQRYNTLLNKLNIKRDKIVGIQTALTTHGQCDAGLTVTFPDADPLSAFRRR